MDCHRRALTVLPVYNEIKHVAKVLDEAVRYSQEVLVVDDGSCDGTSELLAARRDIRVIRHPQNRGYGAALKTAFDDAIRSGYDRLVTIDCDGQHEPALIPKFLEAARHAEIVSGSRYLKRFPGDSRPPEERRRINQQITEEINRRLGLQPDRCFLRLQGLPGSRVGEDRDSRHGLRDASGVLGPGGRIGAADRRVAGPAGLPRRGTIVRRLAGRRPDAAGGLPPGARSGHRGRRSSARAECARPVRPAGLTCADVLIAPAATPADVLRRGRRGLAPHTPERRA